MGLSGVEVTAKNITKTCLILIGNKDQVTNIIEKRKNDGVMDIVLPVSLKDNIYNICNYVEKEHDIDTIEIASAVETCHCYLLMSDIKKNYVVMGVENICDSYVLDFPTKDDIKDGEDLLSAAIKGFEQKTGIMLSKKIKNNIELFTLVGVDMDTIVFICKC